MKETGSKTVIIVGAGLSGICMGIALRQMGLDFLIIEKSSEPGGTWNHNRYPGCGCDIPMFAYCYSFEPFPGDAWPKQPEILEYFKHCIRKYDIEDNIRYRCSVAQARFDTQDQCWHVELDDSSQYSARFLINATGQLNIPSIPQIEGIDSFQKPVVHSAQYPDNLDIQQKTVAVIGNGATALQLVESLQPRVRELLVFSRSPKYIFPRVKYSPITINRMREDPDFWRNVREQFIDSQDQYRQLLNDFPRFDPFEKGSEVGKFYAQSGSSAFEEFDPFYQWAAEKGLRPNYPTGCSRPLVAATFHEAVRATNVRVINEPIQCLDGKTIKTVANAYPVDAVILATGFSLNNLIPPYSIIGSHGISLAESWSKRPEAYLGMTVPGYPNLFFLYGPNTNTNSSSVTFFVESQVNYIRQVLREYRSAPFERIEVKPEILQQYSQWLVQKNSEVSETGSCSSWYKNQDNQNISTFPGNFREYERLTNRFISSEYRMTYSVKENTLVGKKYESNNIGPVLVTLFSETTHLTPTEIDLSLPLQTYPLDSILVVDFIRRINQCWTLTLEPAIFFEHSSLGELASYLVSILGGDKSRNNALATSTLAMQSSDRVALSDSHDVIPRITDSQIDLWKNRREIKRPRDSAGCDDFTSSTSRSTDDEPIAIIGAHGYFPQSPDLQALWRNLVDGTDCISVVPGERWDWRDYDGDPATGDKTRVKWGGFIEDVDRFDPLFFKISPREAELMDPQHRLFLQCAWELLESAGFDASALAGRKIGVLLGVNLNDYAELVTQSATHYDVLQMSGLMHLFGANRLSYLFGFTGPSEVIDTACSSSLIAIHRAIHSIRQDNCEMMLVGGANLMLTPKMHVLYSKAGMLSDDGKCKTFSDQANGYARGEGVAAILLKRLSLAERDGDTILGLIRGSAENHGGKANSLTAPNPKLQAQLIEEAMLAAKVDPRTVSYIECHGTGTALGDPVEINGIKKAYENLYRHYDLQPPSAPYCGLGSIKSNIGHLETAAGIAGLVKILLSFKHQYLPRNLYCSSINPQIHLEGTPFYLVDENIPWEPVSVDGQAQPRRAGISSFGAGGSNAHLVLEEYRPSVDTCSKPQGEGPVLVPLSAKNSDQLKQKAKDLLNYLLEEESPARNAVKPETSGHDKRGRETVQPKAGKKPELAEIAYTLQIGREAMEERLSVVVNTVHQLTEKLQAYVDGKMDIDDLYQGQVKPNKEALAIFNDDEDAARLIEQWITRKKLTKLSDLWVRGFDLDWRKFYDSEKPKRISLPTYPFAKERYWIDTPAVGIQNQDALTNSAATTDYRQEDEQSELLYYREYWQEQAPEDRVPETGDKQYIIFTDAEFQKKLTDEVKTGPLASALFVYESDRNTRLSANTFQCRFNNPNAVHDMIRHASGLSDKPVTLIYDWAKGRGEAGVHALFELFRIVKESPVTVTDVVLVGHYDPAYPDSCWDYSWIGFQRSLKLPLPDLRVSLLYTDTSCCDSRQLLQTLKSGGINRYRDGQRFVLSFARVERKNPAAQPVIKQHGGYLITGGSGVLGQIFANHLASEYQARLLLVGRTPLGPKIQKQLNDLKEAGAREVHYKAVDIADEAALLSFAETLPFDLSGVIHAAGTESAEVFYKKSTADVKQVLYPKSVGTLLLDKVLLDKLPDHQPLDFICYFSSSSALLGDFGACDYAIANRFLMGHAYYRQCTKGDRGKTVVINWPLWKQGGIRIGNREQTATYLKTTGQDALDAATGLKTWHDIMGGDQVQISVMAGKPARVNQLFCRAYQSGPEAQRPAETLALSSFLSNGWKPEFQDFSLDQCLLSDLKQLVCASSKIAPAKLDETVNLADYGFDSITMAQLARQLTSHFGFKVTPDLFFNAPSIRQLRDYFIEEHSQHIHDFYRKPEIAGSGVDTITGGDNAADSAPKFELASSSNKPLLLTDSNATGIREPIAIIGMSGRFPQARSIDQLWELMAAGKNAITDIPASRWDWKDYFFGSGQEGNKISTNKGGFIEGVDEFDPQFFEISPREAKEMDPAERLLLMEAYHAIENARLAPSSLRGSKTGVFVGMEESQYGAINRRQSVTTDGIAMISSRLSYFLDLHGPTIAINTSCSSGLVALHQAVMSLRQGECQAALAAGIALNLIPENYIKMSQAGMLSPDGQCFSFAKKANGIGVGEAIVVVMLKPLSAAIAAGDPIRGIIKASGVNFDGKTNGVTAPNGKMQAELIESIYSDYAIDVKKISHIATHGTGTKLGDPVELNALNKAFNNLYKKQYPLDRQKTRCALTSCKTNFGHTMAASGLVSLVSLLKGMQHQKIPASLYCDEENDYLAWEDGPFYVNKKTQEWKKPINQPYLGAVSAFGRSGTNVHVVIEEYLMPRDMNPQADIDHQSPHVVIVPLSAKTKKQLRQKAVELVKFIRTQASRNPRKSNAIDLISLAYSLQTTRDAMEQRVGFIVHSIAQLLDKLHAYTEGDQNVEGVYQGQVSSDEEILSSRNSTELRTNFENWITANNLPRLLESWVNGHDLDWKKLYSGICRGGNGSWRIDLPVYPFARERYWVETPQLRRSRDGNNDKAAGGAEAIDNLAAIEDVIDQIDNNSIETEHAIRLLNMLV